MNSEMNKLDFSDIELEVYYGEQKEYEAKITYDNSGFIGGEVDDDLNNEHLRGKVAFDSIYQKVKNLTISKDTNKKDAIDQILKLFDLPADYMNFELEIILNDGTKLKYKDLKRSTSEEKVSWFVFFYQTSSIDLQQAGALIEQQISYFIVINLNVVVVNEVIRSKKKDR